MRHTSIAAAGLAACISVATHAQQSVNAPTDAQIAHIVVTANQVDIDAGKLAEKNAASQAVRDFGRTMVTDHTAVNQQATALVQKLGVKPEDNDTSRSLQQGGNDNVAKLRTLSGAAFDKAYVDHEVVYHQAVIDSVDKTLLPSAKNGALKELIMKVRPALVQHLDHARSLQKEMGQ